MESFGDIPINHMRQSVYFQWDWRTCAFAAGGGHLEVLKWLHANGCPWDEETCACAAEGDHLAVLLWAR